MQAHTNQEVVEVLQLVVEHCPSSHLPVQTLCSILQVSRAVNEALQQALGHCRLQLPKQQHGNSSDVARLGACCTWFTKYASLVTELHWSWEDPADLGLDVAAQHLIGLCLASLASKAQAAAAATAATAAAGATLALPQAARAVLPAPAVVPWQLQRVDAQHLLSPSMFESLSTCTSLTSLLLNVDEDSNQSALFTALGGMQQLLELKVYLPGTWGGVFGDAFALAVQQLTRLRSLELSEFNTTAEVVLEALPTSLQSLSAHVDTDSQQPVVVNMAQAVSLDFVKLSVDGTLGAASQLPPHLTQITYGPGGMEAVGGLQELKFADLDHGKACIPYLQHCSALPNLHTLIIDVGDCDVNAPTAGTPADIDQLLAGIAGAQHLTSLELENILGQDVDVPYPTPKHLYGTLLHPHLRRLTALQDLNISSMDIQPADAVHFTCLTALTALKLYNCWSVGEVAIAAMAVRLTRLRVLDLIDCGLESPVLWPAVGMCTSLESLCIDSAPHQIMVLDTDTLHLLTSLTRLTALTGPEINTTAAAYDAFTAAMPALVRMPRFVTLE